MFEKIPGIVKEDSWECSRRFRRMLVKISKNVEKDSEECWQGFGRMQVKILENAKKDCMLYDENRIKGYILKYNKKCAQKLIKTSHMNGQNVVIRKLQFFIPE